MQKIITQALCLLILTTTIVQAADSLDSRSQTSSIELTTSSLPADDFASNRTQFTAKFPLGHLGSYSLRGETRFGYRQTTDSNLFPDDLYHAAGKLRLSNRINSFELGISSASDELFNSRDEIGFILSAARVVKRWDNSSLRLGLAYTSSFDFPLPVFLYTYRGEDLFFTFGLPVAMLRWQINEATTLFASYKPVRQARLALERKLFPTLAVTLEGVLEEESYLIAGRPDSDTSLVLEIPKLQLRVEKQLARQCSGGLSIGRTFDSRFFEREDFNKEENEVQIDDAWVAGLDLKVSF